MDLGCIDMGCVEKQRKEISTEKETSPKESKTSASKLGKVLRICFFGVFLFNFLFRIRAYLFQVCSLHGFKSFIFPEIGISDFLSGFSFSWWGLRCSWKTVRFGTQSIILVILVFWYYLGSCQRVEHLDRGCIILMFGDLSYFFFLMALQFLEKKDPWKNENICPFALKVNICFLA